MIERMFERRSEWKNQFGDFQRMGFWRFFKEQFGPAGGGFFVPLILGLFGIWETIRRRLDIGLPLLVLTVVCTVGLVLYMNFADGTRINPTTGQDYLEVRNRDYFFTPGFMLFGLAIGLGIAAVIDMVRDVFSRFGPVIRNVSFGVASLLVLLPSVPLANNYFYNDRSRNFMAYDYANNYLMSCEKNSIFITNGDNDTFPVWCLQEVYGIRKDVKVVNLSLANTQWYMRQLRDQHGVPISFTDEQIDNIRGYRTQDGTVFRIQDQLVDNILVTNRWKYPVHLGFTVPEDNRKFKGRTLDSNLVLEGMVFTLVTDRKGTSVNFDLTSQRYLEDYSYRGIADSTIHKNESTARLMNNYVQGFLFIADSLRVAGDYEGALAIVRKSMELNPASFDNYAYACQVFAYMGYMDTLVTFIEEAPTTRKRELYFNWGVSSAVAGRFDDAEYVLELTHEKFPEYLDGFRQLVRLHYQRQNWDRLYEVVNNWINRHPDDLETKGMLRQLNRDKIERERSGDST